MTYQAAPLSVRPRLEEVSVSFESRGRKLEPRLPFVVLVELSVPAIGFEAVPVRMSLHAAAMSLDVAVVFVPVMHLRRRAPGILRHVALDFADDALDGSAYVLSERTTVEAARTAEVSRVGSPEAHGAAEGRSASRVRAGEKTLFGHRGDDLLGLDPVEAVSRKGFVDAHAPAHGLRVLEDRATDIGEHRARGLFCIASIDAGRPGRLTLQARSRGYGARGYNLLGRALRRGGRTISRRILGSRILGGLLVLAQIRARRVARSGLAVLGIELDVGAYDLECVYLLRDVLERDLAEFFRPELDFVEDLVVDILRKADAAGLGQRLQPRGDVDALAQGVVFEEVDISQMHADPDEEREVPVLLVVRIEFVLYLHRALEGFDRVLEIDEKSVAYGLDDRAVMAAGDFADQIVMEREQNERGRLVPLHHPGESRDIRVHYGGETVIFLFHAGLRIDDPVVSVNREGKRGESTRRGV